MVNKEELLTEAGTKRKQVCMRDREWKTVIIGVGNLLLRDEGVGIHVTKELEKLHLPDVEVYDLGRDILDVIFALEGCDKGIIIDAVKRGGKPGTVYRFKSDEVETKDSINRITKAVSVHQIDVPMIIGIGRGAKLDLPTDIIVVGVEPKIIEIGLELSPEVKKAIPRVIELIIQEIHGG